MPLSVHEVLTPYTEPLSGDSSVTKRRSVAEVTPPVSPLTWKRRKLRYSGSPARSRSAGSEPALAPVLFERTKASPAVTKVLFDPPDDDPTVKFQLSAASALPAR